MHKYLISVATTGIAFVASTGIAFAAPSADLSVQVTGPSTVSISTPTTYTVTVKNFGPSTANPVAVTVAFLSPLQAQRPLFSVRSPVSILVVPW